MISVAKIRKKKIACKYYRLRFGYDYLNNYIIPLFRRNHPSEEDVGDGNTEGDEQDGERGLDGIVHSYCYLALDAVHVDKGKQGPIHEHTGNHGDDAGDAEQLVRGVQLANERTADDADYCRTCKRTYYQALVQSDVTAGWTEINEIARANADDAT